MDAKRNAIEALNMKSAPRRDAHDTKNGYDTILSRRMKGMSQVVDFLVELSGIEPLASSLRTRRSPS
jgi:hypothetical protein